MLLVAAAFAAVATPESRPRGPVRAIAEARATVRILAGARLHFGEEGRKDGFLRRDTIVRSVGGTEPARLIEFE